MHAGLSTGAELLLLAIDPDDGELLPRRRLRFLRALAEGARPRRGAALRGFAARRRALRELRDAGVVEEEGMRPVDRLAGGKRFRRIREGLVAESLGERDDTLLVLLAYSGLLVPRLSRDERLPAHRLLRGSWRIRTPRPGAAARRRPRQRPRWAGRSACSRPRTCSTASTSAATRPTWTPATRWATTRPDG